MLDWGWQRLADLKLVFKRPSTGPSPSLSADFLQTWSVFSCLSWAKSAPPQTSCTPQLLKQGSQFSSAGRVASQKGNRLTSSLAYMCFLSLMSTKSFGSNFPWLCLSLFLWTTFILFERFVGFPEILNFIFSWLHQWHSDRKTVLVPGNKVPSVPPAPT